MEILGGLKATPERIKNIDSLVQALNEVGYTNKYLQAAILAVVAKESGFIPKDEVSYANTNNGRIRSIFSVFRDYSDSELSAIKKDPKAFFDIVYGGRYGNNSSEGYKYRGRGYNQLTFKGNYKAIGDAIGVDLVANPDLANDSKIAAKILVEYFKRNFDKYPSKVKLYSPTDNANNVDEFKKAVHLAAHANAGFGNSSGGTRVANAINNTNKYSAAMLAYLSGSNFLKKNSKIITIYLTLGVIGVIAYYGFKKMKK